MVKTTPFTHEMEVKAHCCKKVKIVKYFKKCEAFAIEIAFLYHIKPIGVRIFDLGFFTINWKGSIRDGFCNTLNIGLAKIVQ